MNRHTWRHALLTTLLIAGLGTALAQDEEDNKPVVYDIELKPDTRMDGGVSAFLQGGTDETGTRFQVKESQLMQPVSVGVYTRTPNEHLRLRVVKDDWSKPVRDVTTENGRVDLNFRTYDGFKLWVTADTPTEYQLVVWMGEEQVPQLPAVAVPASEYREPATAAAAASSPAAGHSFSTLELALIGMLALLFIGGGAFFLGRRKSS